MELSACRPRACINRPKESRSPEGLLAVNTDPKLMKYLARPGFLQTNRHSSSWWTIFGIIFRLSNRFQLGVDKAGRARPRTAHRAGRGSPRLLRADQDPPNIRWSRSAKPAARPPPTPFSTPYYEQSLTMASDRPSSPGDTRYPGSSLPHPRCPRSRGQPGRRSNPHRPGAKDRGAPGWIRRRGYRR